MMWPQLTYIFLTVLGLGFTIAKHGEPRDPYSMWNSLFGTAIVLTLLYYGGFFAALGVAP